MWKTQNIQSRETGETLENWEQSAPIKVSDIHGKNEVKIAVDFAFRPRGSEYSVMLSQLSDIKNTFKHQVTNLHISMIHVKWH